MIRFEQAASVALERVRASLPGAFEDATVVRDPLGLVSVVLGERTFAEPAERERLAQHLHVDLAHYSPGPQAVLFTREELFDPEDIYRSPDRITLDGGGYLLDRLITNQDWLRAASDRAPGVPTLVGFSVKGGVGRTTALAVLAWHLVRQGHDVVVVDLDLEAPGLGSMLLPRDAWPAQGLVDWLAEDLVGQGDVLAIGELLGSSPLADGESGRLLVLPAFGTDTRAYIPKLGRVLMPVSDAAGRPDPLASRLRRLFDRVIDERKPTVMLIDARAGVSDLGAAAVTQLGAQVLFFTRDEDSGWEAWHHLFQHLAHSRGVVFGGPDNDLRWRLKMVGAQVEPTVSAQRRLVERCYALWSDLYDAVDDAGAEASGARPLSFVEEEEAGPHHPLVVPFEPAMRGRSLAVADERPTWDVVERAYRPFLDGALARLGLLDESCP